MNDTPKKTRKPRTEKPITLSLPPSFPPPPKQKKKPECHTCPLNGKADVACLKCPAAKEFFCEFGKRDTVSLDALTSDYADTISTGYENLATPPATEYYDDPAQPDVVERRQIKRYMSMLIDFAKLPESDWRIVKQAIISLSSSSEIP